MTESAFLLLGILLVGGVLTALTAVALARVRAPAPRRVQPDAKPAAVAAQVLCPETGRLAGVDIGVEPMTHHLEVLWCERFPDGVVTCERDCFRAAAAA